MEPEAEPRRRLFVFQGAEKFWVFSTLLALGSLLLVAGNLAFCFFSPSLALLESLMRQEFQSGVSSSVAAEAKDVAH